MKKNLKLFISIVAFFSLLLSSSIIPNMNVMGLEVYPDAVFTNTPELNYEFSSPNKIAAPGDLFAPELSDHTADNVPVISTITETAAPGEAIIVGGENFKNASVKVFGLNGSGYTVFLDAEIVSITETAITAIIPSSFVNGVFLIWVKNINGYSRPVRINNPIADWCSSDKVCIADDLSIYGKNFILNDYDNVFVYMDNGISVIPCEVTYVNPYKLTFKIPQTAINDTYSLWIHNGHGGVYAWYNIGNIEVRDSIWNGCTYTLENSTVEALKYAISIASDYDTIRIPYGNYTVDQQININKKLRIIGIPDNNGNRPSIKSTLQNASSAVFYITRFPSIISNLEFTDDLSVDLAPRMVYAHGYDAPADSRSGFLLENCNFDIKHSWCNADVCYQNHADCIFGYSNVSNCVSVADINNINIGNNTFSMPKGISIYNCRYTEIHDNVAYGKWVLHSVQGGSFVQFGGICSNIDVNNNIVGSSHLSNSNGSFAEGDLVFNRALVLQGRTENIYIAQNNVSGCGHINQNSGEIFLFENNRKLFEDKPSTVSGKNIAFAVSSVPSKSLGATVVILNGKGVGQYRTISQVNGNIITIDKSWDIEPDETSTAMIVEPFKNTVIYSNKVVGPKNYNDNDNASCAVQGYGNMLNLTVANNDFSYLSVGILCSPHYTTNLNYECFSTFERLMICDNKISKTRYGVSIKFTYFADKCKTNSEIPAIVCKNAIIRNNRISDTQHSNASYFYDLSTGKSIGGDAIFIGTLAKNRLTSSTNDYWLGSWIDSTVIENNVIENAYNSGIRLGYHQGNTLEIANETNIGYEKLGDDDFPYPNEIYSYQGSIYGSRYSTCKMNYLAFLNKQYATEQLRNADFSQGLKYWCNKGDYSADIPNGITVTDGALTFENANKWSGVSSFQFKIPEVNDDNYISAVFKFKGNVADAQAQLTQVRENDSEEQNNIKGNVVWLTDPTPTTDEWGWATITFNKNTAAGRPVANISKNDTFWFGIESKVANASFSIDDIKIVSVFGTEKYFKDVYTGEMIYSDKYYGTEAAGTTSRWDLYENAVTQGNVLEEIQNANFSQGLKFWGNGADNKKGQRLSNGIYVTENTLHFICTDDNWDGIATMPFKVSNAKNGDYLTAIFKIKTNNITDIQAEVKQLKPYGMTNGAVKGNLKWLIKPDASGWGLATINIPANATPIANLEELPAFFLNIKIAKKGVSLDLDYVKMTFNNKLGNNFYDAYTGEKIYGEIVLGDVNEDDVVNILDLVRMKKYIVGENVRICYEAANLDSSSSEIDAADLIALRILLLNQ